MTGRNATTITSLPPPHVFGLPDKFVSWRPNQWEALTRIDDSQLRFIAMICPTGFGKSLVYMAAAALSGRRTLILTGTKGLQTQLMADFAPIGLADIRGKNSYRCKLENDGTTCDHGPCVAGVACPLRESGGCDYYEALSRARQSRLVVTNYAYWMNQLEYGAGLGQFEMLVCDEAHGAPDHVSSFIEVVVSRRDEVAKSLIPDGDLTHLALDEWRVWASNHLDRLERELERLAVHIKAGGADRRIRRRYASIKKLVSDLARVRRMGADWIVSSDEYKVAFSPIWPAPYCEKALFNRIERVVLTSASICGKTMDMMGTGDETDVVEYGHSFPVANRMLMHVPTVRMNHRTDQYGMRLWLARIDQIIGARLDRKGIVHTVSYDRCRTVMSNSKHKSIMLSHGRRDVVDAVARFKAAPPPKVLVSPTMTTGWDFPYTQAEYAIIGKIAYPDTRDRIIRARTKADPDYASYVAMQQLVQACGRGVRAADDVCENIVIDDNAVWFVPKYKEFAPKWFTKAYRREKMVPRPGPVLRRVK